MAVIVAASYASCMILMAMTSVLWLSGMARGRSHTWEWSPYCTKKDPLRIVYAHNAERCFAFLRRTPVAAPFAGHQSYTLASSSVVANSTVNGKRLARVNGSALRITLESLEPSAMFFLFDIQHGQRDPYLYQRFTPACLLSASVYKHVARLHCTQFSRMPYRLQTAMPFSL